MTSESVNHGTKDGKQCVLKKITAAYPDQGAIYDCAWSGNSQARLILKFLALNMT